jgi:hypothetical protein
MTSVALALVVLLLVLMLRIVARPAWLATPFAWLLLTALETASMDCDVSFPWLTSGVIVAIAMVLLIRVGLVALMASSFFCLLLLNSPMTADFHAWYAPAGVLAVSLAAALLLYGFFTSGVRRPAPWRRLLDGC